MERRTLALNMAVIGLFLACAMFIVSGSALAAGLFDPVGSVNDIINNAAKWVFALMLTFGAILFFFFGYRSKGKLAPYIVGIILLIPALVIFSGVRL